MSIRNNQELIDKFIKMPSGDVARYKGYVDYSVVNEAGEVVRSDNMNLWEWMDIQRDSRRSKFRFNRFLDMETVEVTENRQPATENTIIEDPLECPLCGMIAKTEASLKAHKTKKHSG